MEINFQSDIWQRWPSILNLSFYAFMTSEPSDFSIYIRRVKFEHSEKHIKFEKIFHLHLTLLSSVKFKWKIFSNFVCFSEYPNFKSPNLLLKVQISLFFKSAIQVSFEHVHFLAKNLSEFVSPSLKLHSQYCHIEGAFQIHIEFDDWGHYNA